jgi:hypothetical protein
MKYSRNANFFFPSHVRSIRDGAQMKPNEKERKKKKENILLIFFNRKQNFSFFPLLFFFSFLNDQLEGPIWIPDIIIIQARKLTHGRKGKKEKAWR